MESRLLLLSRSRLLLKAESSYVMLARLLTIQPLSKKVSITYRRSIPNPPVVTKSTYFGHPISQCWTARSSEGEEEDRAKTLREDLSVRQESFFSSHWVSLEVCTLRSGFNSQQVPIHGCSDSVWFKIEAEIPWESLWLCNQGEFPSTKCDYQWSRLFSGSPQTRFLLFIANDLQEPP